MKQDLENKTQIQNYLLGEMNEAERNRFEEQIFADENLSFSLDAAENDLIDEYLRSELTAEEKQKFEQNFLVSERRQEKLELAKVLHSEVFDKKGVTIATASQTTFFEQIAGFFRLPRLALAGGLAAIVLFTLVGGFLLLRQTEQPQVANLNEENQNVPVKPINQTEPPVNKDLPDSNLEPEKEPTTVEENKNPKIENKPETELENKPTPQKLEKTQPQPRQVFAFKLFPPTRSGKVPQIVIPENAKTIRLNVVNDQPQEFIRFRGEIRTAEGKVIWNREIPANSKTAQQTIVFNIEADKFANGLYELTLIGVTPDRQYEEINFYNFTVRKKE